VARLTLLAAACALAVSAAGSADPGDSSPALLAVESDGYGEVYTLVCRGNVEHRLLQDAGGTLVTVEFTAAGSEVGVGDLPDPAGPVRAISLGGGEGTVRLSLALKSRAAAVVLPHPRGLELRLIPLEEDGREIQGEVRPLGTEDLLEITVFEVPDLSRTVRISEKGTVSLPLIGEVLAAGLTPREFELRIREHLESRYVKDPQVTVFVQEHGSKKVSVLGGVGKPGVYEMLGPRTLLQVIAQAGGFTEKSGAELFVIRADPGGGHQRIPVDIEALMTSRDPSLNLVIQPGDVVSVPRDRMIFVYVDGAVGKPGRYEQPASRKITLMQAIAKAGGATERANLKKVQILRKGPSGKQTTMLLSLTRIRQGKEPDPVLQDGDVVVIRETFF
jgi:polysaccharide export outer membrane protein